MCCTVLCCNGAICMQCTSHNALSSAMYYIHRVKQSSASYSTGNRYTIQCVCVYSQGCCIGEYTWVAVCVYMFSVRDTYEAWHMQAHIHITRPTTLSPSFTMMFFVVAPFQIIYVCQIASNDKRKFV